MSFKITFAGKVKTFDKPVRVLDLLGSDNNFFCALVNNRVRELTHELTADSVIEPLTLTHSESVRIYQTSLRYLVAMAMNRIRPEIKIRFSYNVSRSIFIQILNEGIRADRELVHELEQEMKRLIAADIPFNRSKISVEEAAKIYEERGFEDKLEVLKYRPEKTVHMYECDGYLNYMYGFMVPSTAYLNQWILKPYSPGMILQYPRNECKGEIPEFKDAPTFGKTLKQSHAWSKNAGLESVTGINRYVEGGHEVDLITICEARH